MEQLTKNQAVATSQEAVQNQNEPQLRDENAHNDKSVHGVLNPTYQAGLRRDAVQPDIEAELVDPNFGRRVRNRRQLNSLQNTWPYGYSMPIAVRYTQDAFSRSGWLWPVDAKGEPLKATSYM